MRQNSFKSRLSDVSSLCSDRNWQSSKSWASSLWKRSPMRKTRLFFGLSPVVSMSKNRKSEGLESGEKNQDFSSGDNV